jgi:hypothetical protein
MVLNLSAVLDEILLKNCHLKIRTYEIILFFITKLATVRLEHQ